MSNRTSGNLQLAKAALSQSESSAPVSAEYDANMEAIDSAISSGGGTSPIQTATVTLSAAQMQHIATDDTPIVLVGGEAGKALIPISAFAQYKFGTTPYTVPTPAYELAITTLFNGAQEMAALFVINTEDASQIFSGLHNRVGLFRPAMYQTVPQLFSDNDQTIAVPEDSFWDDEQYWSSAALGLVANSSGGQNLADGDGTLTVTVFYTVVTLS